MARVSIWKGLVARPGDDDCVFVDADFGIVAVWHWMGGETVGNAFAPIIKDILRTYVACAAHRHQYECLRRAGHASRWNPGDGTKSWLHDGPPAYARNSASFQGGGIATELEYIFQIASDAIRDLQTGTRQLGIGASLTVARITGSRLVTANAGDCRVCIARAGRIFQITEDHVKKHDSGSVYTRLVVEAPHAQPPAVTDNDFADDDQFIITSRIDEQPSRLLELAASLEVGDTLPVPRAHWHQSAAVLAVGGA